MKSKILKALKITLLVVLAVLAVLLIVGVVLALNWPLWVSIFLVLLVIGIGVGIFFLRRILRRKKEQQFVAQVIEQDEARLKNLTGKEKEELKELQERWKQAVDSLRKSHLKKKGNPLYVLPWYLFLGESGSGKTTSINSARLSSPFAEVNRISGISGTRNCDWWFFEQAIIIDTAGRYAIPVDEGRDKEEWQKFMSLLVKYRKKEPLNGLIVTIAADKLTGSAPQVLEDDGRSIRRRIDELMRVTGVKFPVYVVITKCDLIQGMTQFCDSLPESSLDQPMGYLNRNFSGDLASFLDDAMTAIVDRLRALRILLLHRSAGTVDPGLLLFPEEMNNLKQKISAFMKGAFSDNPYQESVILRGLFFSSGRQEGSPYSNFLNALGLMTEKEILPGTNKGLFLHDLFSGILPKDRSLFTPTRKALEWRMITRNLGLVSWVIVGIALCGLLSFSFVKNLKAIREASHEFALPSTKGELTLNLIDMDRFSQTIVRLEERNNDWWIPRFGLSESIDVERALKAKYCDHFQGSLLVNLDKQMTAAMTGFNASTADEITGNYVLHLARRINILKARMQEQGFEKIRTKPQPPFIIMSASNDKGAGSQIRERFGMLYLHYVMWRTNNAEINKETAALQSWLRYLLDAKQNDLKWVAAWVDRQGSVPAITLTEFWGGSQSSNEKTVAPSYTRKGKEMVDSFIAEIETALPDAQLLAYSKADFYKWYREASFESWQNFAAAFPDGKYRLKNRKDWQEIAAKGVTEQSPYFAFMNRAAMELGSVSETGDTPDWLMQIYQFMLMKGRTQGAITKAAEEGMKMVSAIEKKIGSAKDEKSALIESQLLLSKSVQDYVASLSQVTAVAASRNQAYQTAVQVYGEDPSSSKSPFYAAYASLSKVKNSLGAGKPADRVAVNLVAGLADLLWEYTRMETACALQSQWEEKVLAETQGTSGMQKTALLLSQDGPVWKFVKGPAAPFVGWSVTKGYYSREALGGNMPFDSDFFKFLTKGAKAAGSVPGAGGGGAGTGTKMNYTISIRGLPTDSNSEARSKPHATRIELQCAGGVQSLINLNYPAGRTFNWTPDSCGDVNFQIEVADVILKKRYTGEHAFPDFIQDFPGGHRTFYPNDFPNDRRALDRLGIKFIKVNYQFSGQQNDMVKKVRSIPGQAPRTIAKCWDR